MAKHRPSDRSADAQMSTEAQTFRAAVHDVKPLAHTPRAPGLEQPKPRHRVARQPRLTPEPLDTAMPLIAGTAIDADLEPVTSDGALAFHRAGVRTQVSRRLRRGLYPVEAELDLHGLAQTAARLQLAEFIERSRDAGFRCVRIIHGKGYRSGARGPVLKAAVNLWLRRHLDVMAFVSARPIDGGAGAVYVLLRA